MKNENVILDTIVEKEFNEMKLSPKEKINYLLLNYLDRLDVEPIFQKAVEQYANQIVIEELEKIANTQGPHRYTPKIDALYKRIKELKQE